MSHFEKNMEKIVHLLMESDNFITLDSLSRQVGTSKRSVQNYINKIQPLLSDIGVKRTEIIKKQGCGIKLLIDEEDKAKLRTHLKIEKSFLFNNVTIRRIEILKALIFSNDELTIQFFADQFYISRTVILKDLEWISQWLAKYNLQLFKCQRRGIGIIGNEVCRRNAIAGFFDIYKAGEEELIAGIGPPSRISEEKCSRLKSIYPKINIQPICTIIEDAEKKFDFFLTDEYFLSLVTHMIISIARLKSGKNVDEDFLPPDDEYGDLERKTSEYISGRLESEYNLRMPESEKTYICMHLMGYNAFNLVKDAKRYIPKRIELLAISLIDFIDNQLGTTFAADKVLFFGIVFHLKTSIYRLEDNILNNTFIENDLFKDNQEIFNAVSKAAFLYQEICSVKVNQEEISALAIHFILSQKRNLKKKRVLLVCDSGIISGVNLFHFISNSYHDIDIMDICSSFQLPFISDDEYDFIISTTALDNSRKPVADLSHVGKDEYDKFLDDFIFSFLLKN